MHRHQNFIGVRSWFQFLWRWCAGIWITNRHELPANRLGDILPRRSV